MPKSKKAKNKQQRQDPLAGKKINTLLTPAPSPPKTIVADPTNLSTLIPAEDLDITVDTLKLLAEYPSLIKLKACKDLRVAVFDFRQAATTGLNSAGSINLTARITAALADEQYTEARILLAEMRIRNDSPKLGALCRWVRDVDVVSGLSAEEGGMSHSTPEGIAKNKELLLVLDAILRVTGPTDRTLVSTSSTDPIALQNVWNLHSSDMVREEVYKRVLDKSILQVLPDGMAQKFRIIETTPPLERKPPNLHPAILYASENNAVNLSATPPGSSHHAHPIVPNLSFLRDILSPAECAQIIAAGELMEFTPDAPVRELGLPSSVLAHNFYWIVDNAFNDKLWSRVKAYVPEVVNGKKVRGINRRFRVYRYVAGAEYRCHIDGAWPPSSIDSVTDKYIYDSSPADAPQSSLFTFLIYLNDEFDAGETTFFLPSATDGILNAYPVKPMRGSVIMFPHGEAVGSLLHEGTGVRGGGAKYVIRTDVLYDVNSTV